MSNQYSIGLSLSGGGARGFAHLGAIKALEEMNIKPDVISGTSAGAIIAAFICNGKTADETFQILRKKSFFEFTKFRLLKSGFVRLEGLKTVLKKHLTVANIEDLQIPLNICVSNINKGKAEYLNKGNLINSVIASSSIPILIAPIKLETNDYYLDGGIFDNLPIKPLRNICHKVIGVHISPIVTDNNLQNMIDISTRVFQLSAYSNAVPNFKFCDVLIEPIELSNHSLLDTSKADEMFEIGYIATKKSDLSCLS